MEIDPMEYAEDRKEDEAKEASKARLNGMVAVAVALIATFMAICNVKDGNVAQDMQSAQAKSIDDWSWYQARNTRIETIDMALAQVKLGALAQSGDAKAAYDKQVDELQKLKQHETDSNAKKRTDAEADDKLYSDLNYVDDQFDASEAFIGLAISMLAVTSLTQKHWLFWVAMVPTFFGVLMGLSGLCGWKIHLDFLAQWLA